MNAQQQDQQLQTEVKGIAEEAKLDRVIEGYADRLDAIASAYTEALEHTPAPLRRAMMMAEGIAKLRKAMTREIMDRIMGLMNSKLGFRTDRPSAKQPKPYLPEEVRDAVIEGLLKGVYPVGNEMNIIAGQCYVTQEGYTRRVRELPGLTDLKLSPGNPKFQDGRWLVRYGATWRYEGIEHALIDGEGKAGRVFPVVGYENSGPDQIIGKATRKALKAIYEECTGSEQSGEIDDIPDIDEPGRTVPATSDLPTTRQQVARKRGRGWKGADAATTPPDESHPALPPVGPEPEAEVSPIEAQAPPGPDENDPVQSSGLDQDELAAADFISDCNDWIAQAKTLLEIDEAGNQLTAWRERIGEQQYQTLLFRYQSKRRGILGREQRR